MQTHTLAYHIYNTQTYAYTYMSMDTYTQIHAIHIYICIQLDIYMYHTYNTDTQRYKHTKLHEYTYTHRYMQYNIYMTTHIYI